MADERTKVPRLAKVVLELERGDGQEPYRVGVEVQVDHAVNGMAAVQAIQRAVMPMAAANQVSQVDLILLMTEDMGDLMDKLKESFDKKRGSL
jgi:hypothetical protein